MNSDVEPRAASPLTAQADHAAHVVLAQAARDGERMASAARLALGLLTLVVWPLYKTTHPSAGSDIAVLGMALGACALGAFVLWQLRGGRAVRGWTLASITGDALLVVGGFAFFVWSPPPHYLGLVREPGLALAYLALLASGLRLTRRGTGLAALLLIGGTTALIVVDAQVHGDLPWGPGNVLTVEGCLVGAAALAWLIASRTQRQVLAGASATAREIGVLNAQLAERVRVRSLELTAALESLAERRATAALSAGTVLNGRFTIVRPLGAGGMGQVYEATDDVTGDAVALKIILARSARQLDWQHRFLKEARAAVAVEHPAIVKVLHVDVTGDGLLFQVQELLDGVSLEDALVSGPLPLEVCVRVGAVLAGALSALHAAGVVHRDVKPANVMLLRAPPGLKLLDFGIAQLEGDSEPAGVVVGTPAYMAPEQRAGGEVSAPADLWAVGVLLRHAHPEGDARLDAWGQRCTAMRPEDRPDARSLEAGLKELAETLGAPPLEETVHEHAARAPPGPLSLLLGEIAHGTGMPAGLGDVSPRLGRYVLERRLGDDVWRARDEVLARPVVLRLVARDAPVHARLAFLARAHAAARVWHPALCSVLDVDDALGVMALEDVAGDDLELLCAGGIESNRADGIARALVGALAAAHRAGVAHGAVRADQVRLTSGGVKLLGLGSRAGDHGDDVRQLVALLERLGLTASEDTPWRGIARHAFASAVELEAALTAG